MSRSISSNVNRKRRVDNDENDGSRRSRCLSDVADDAFATPATVSRSHRVTRNTFKFCADIDGLSGSHHCDGCQCFRGSTRKITKPRTEIATKTLQCAEMWKLDPSKVPPIKLCHYERAMEAIANYERIELTVLIQNLGNAT